MAKLALCIKRTSAPQAVIDAFAGDKAQLIPIDASFWNTLTSLQDRAYCETDETYLQLLPYIHLRTPDGKSFRYTRGGGGEEARLHGNYSVGIGGHVDVAPDEDSMSVRNLISVIQTEAGREIAEEVNLSVRPEDLKPTHFIVDPTNEVGKVHLGLLITYNLQVEEVDQISFEAEKGVIENVGFYSTEELGQLLPFSRLENWSKVLVVSWEGDIESDDEGAGDNSYSLPSKVEPIEGYNKDSFAQAIQVQGEPSVDDL